MANGKTVTLNKEYKVIKDLGQGACGKTTLVLDDTIGEYYVAKEFSPTRSRPDLKEELFERFVREVKILHKLAADSVVRIFSNDINVQEQKGLIVMEYVQGKTINQYVKENPDSVESLFEQSIKAFKYLTEVNVLHRDIRNENIMVNQEGEIKIIDFGFGKSYDSPESLEEYSALEVARNHRPLDNSYDVSTEIFYLGWLFKELMGDDGLYNFRYRKVINKMLCETPEQRYQTFEEVNNAINKRDFEQEDLTENQVAVYQAFAKDLSSIVEHVFAYAVYYDDTNWIENKFTETYRAARYEKLFPSGSAVLRCFMKDGSFECNQYLSMNVKVFREFTELYASSVDKVKRNLLAHIWQRLDCARIR